MAAIEAMETKSKRVSGIALRVLLLRSTNPPTSKTENKHVQTIERQFQWGLVCVGRGQLRRAPPTRIKLHSKQKTFEHDEQCVHVAVLLDDSRGPSML